MIGQLFTLLDNHHTEEVVRQNQVTRFEQLLDLMDKINRLVGQGYTASNWQNSWLMIVEGVVELLTDFRTFQKL